MFPHISHRAEACTTAASFYRSPKMVRYLYLLCSVEYRYCTISNYYGPGTPFRHAHQLFSVSWRLGSHPGVEYQEGFFLRPLTVLCVEADENTLKVNGPLRLSSSSSWLPVAVMTLLLQSEYHSHSPSSLLNLKNSSFSEAPDITLS